MQKNKILIVSNDSEFCTFIQKAMQSSIEALQAMTPLDALKDISSPFVPTAKRSAW